MIASYPQLIAEATESFPSLQILPMFVFSSKDIFISKFL